MKADDSPDRRYICTSCDSIVRARWGGSGSFSVGCDCKTVPVVPQMGQAETPESWRVERPECCRDFEPGEMETVYGKRADVRCPDCGAEYSILGMMVNAPEPPEDPDEDQQRLVAGGSSFASKSGGSE